MEEFIMNRFARFAASALALSLVPAMLMGCGKKEASTGSVILEK